MEKAIYMRLSSSQWAWLFSVAEKRAEERLATPNVSGVLRDLVARAMTGRKYQ